MGLCEKCQSKGLPIYPVRYAVAPKYIKADLPSWAKNDMLPILKGDSKYVLRTMRAGYLYVLCQYEDNMTDLDISIYRVDEQGGFWQQDISKEQDILRFDDTLIEENLSIPFNDIQTTCGNSAHLSSNIAFITLSNPEKCEKTWLAFSEHKWSAKTLKKYRIDEDKRNLRMQLIKPKQWLNSQTNGIGITTANQEAIASTLDIQNLDDFKERITTSLPKFKSINYSFCFPYLYDNKPLDKSTLSQSAILSQPFTYDKQLFKKRSTLAPWQSLTKPVYDPITPKELYSVYLHKKMMSAERNSTDCSPMMVVLNDSIGIAAELSHWGNSALNSFRKIMTERQRENATCSGIAMLEAAIKNRDLADSEEDFKKQIKNTNRKYLSDAKYFNKKVKPHDIGVLGTDTTRIIPWSEEQKAQGQRVINMVSESKNYNFVSQYPNPYLTDIEQAVKSTKYSAAILVQFVQENYLLEEMGEERHAQVFEQVFKLNKQAEMVNIKRLDIKLAAIRIEFEAKAQAYKAAWHEKNKTEQSAEKRWRKYEYHLNKDYKLYKEKYAAFLQEAENYIAGLLNDLILWVDCSKQKERHPISLSADDFAQDDDNYLAFANDILMTLGMQAQSSKVTQLFTQLIEDKNLEGHNIVWSAAFAHRKLDKEKQKKCVNFLLSLNKTTQLKPQSYGEFLNKLETVLEFYQAESAESNAMIGIANSIANIRNSLFDPKNEHKELDLTKEFFSLFESERNSLVDGDSIDNQVTAAYLRPIKEGSCAVLISLLNYIQKMGGDLSSEFAEAFLVAISPTRLSKTALKMRMVSYHKWANNLTSALYSDIKNVGEKLANASQKATNLIKQHITNEKVGASFTAAILGVHIMKIYYIVTDNSLKTQAQQNQADYQLTMAVSASMAASFRLVTVYANKGQINAKLLSNMNFLGNFFGVIAGLIDIGLNWNEDTSEKDQTQKTLYYASLFTLIVSTTDLFLQMGKTSLIKIMERGIQSLATLSVKFVLTRSVTFLTGRALLLITALALNPWVSLGIFLLQLYFELTKDDDIEEWLKRCRFGSAQNWGNSKYSSRYKSSKEEIAALQAIFKKYEDELAEYYAEQEQKRIKENMPVFSSSDWQIIDNWPIPQ
ncbi:T6SS effector BTH_I2691 family protein [Gilliamella sp. App4-10]|uniref:T6SS effector BTH_I2691 family protein n=1 Tax=Gilliamella sp. App4-10 TaxID=3120231 RepID=UPI00080E87B0|nr:T6SS effector BTH_I2691 family protein [Gilliamella apicola]OCG22152.1 hypothetical protein A9G23_03475 [Gilliamella apicola]